MEETSEHLPCLTFLFPQPTVDDIALGKHLFPSEDTRYLEVHRTTWILGVRGVLLVANIFATALVFFHPISRNDLNVPLSQICLIMAFLIIPAMLILTTFFGGKHRMEQETLPYFDGRWYWGLLAIAVHTCGVLSVADLIGFLIFQAVPSLQGTVDIGNHEQAGWWTEVAIQRYVMVAAAVTEFLLVLVPQHYFFVVTATAWYAIWQLVMFIVRNKKLSSNTLVVISLAGTSIVSTLSLLTVFFHKQLVSAFKKRRFEEFCALTKTVDKEIVFESAIC